MVMTDSATAALEARMARRHHLGQAAMLASWDMQTGLPAGAAEARGETLAALAAERHRLLADPETEALAAAAGAALAEAGPEADPGGWRRANLARIDRLARAARAAPTDLVAALARAEAACETVWRAARPADDFASLRPSLETVTSLVRQRADALVAAGLAPTAHDALLDEFQPGLAAARVDALFAPLAERLPPLLEDALARQDARDRAAPPRPAPAVPTGGQEAAARALIAAVGFDFERGRLGVSAHPFCSGGDDDARITSRYDEADFLSALMAALHETGHALYEQGLPRAWREQPVGRAAGMAVHESQSLLLEMQICRGRPFLGFAAPIVAQAFGRDAADPAFGADALVARAQRLGRGFIRVEADEVSYPLHILLRDRLERGLLSGALAVADLPEAWRAASRALFGRAPETDREGCLQDVHWPAGLFGYFPTYAIGAMAAAQFYEALSAARPRLDAEIAAGDFAGALGWLRAAVHGQGARRGFEALIAEATGAPLGPEAFLRRLAARYGGR